MPDDAFPRFEIEAAGYHVATHGQKRFNGVAILSRLRPDDVTRGLPRRRGRQPGALHGGGIFHPKGVVRVASIYLPNGNPPDTDKYPYKLGFMERLRRRATSCCGSRSPWFSPATTTSSPSRSTPMTLRPGSQTRSSFRRPARPFAGYRRSASPMLSAPATPPERYSFWDYQAGAFQKNNGIRIDHLLLSPRPPTGS